MAKRASLIARTISTPAILMLILLAFALVAAAVIWLKIPGAGPFGRTIVEMLIRVMLVVGIYIFVGNSGVISFGHIGFMCIGAYATAWFTIPPMMKKVTL